MDLHITRDPSNSEPDGPTEFKLAGEFVEYLFSREEAQGHSNSSTDSRRRTIDWVAIEDAAAGSESPERGVGRSIVMADLLSRGVYEAPGSESTTRSGPLSRSGAAAGHALSDRKGMSSFIAATTVLLVTLVVALTAGFGGSTPTPPKPTQSHGIVGNAQLVSNAVPASLTALPATTTTVSLPAATAPPAPAPPSLADAPPLRPHEVFGFAPYWTLSQSGAFDLSHISTIAYFSIGVNPDGTLDESGPGWNGYQSQAFADLVTRAHGAGDRVVLTVNDFGQSSLDQLTSSATAPGTLATAVIGALQAKHLDGVNFDFEGTGSADQVGLTNLVTQVSGAVHAADPNYQVTMDTYASAAAGSGGFYNISALAPAVDGFFVMAYQLNLQSAASTSSPLTSTMFSEKTAIDEYLTAAPTAKVILGLPYFGIDWPTSDGTLTAQATGPATTVTYGQVMASGHPIYWDATTDTGWTSYLVGTQWHESFFEVPSALYDAAQLATSNELGGVGIWALGMDGNDPNMTSALAGLSPAVKDYSPGPATIDDRSGLYVVDHRPEFDHDDLNPSSNAETVNLQKLHGHHDELVGLDLVKSMTKALDSHFILD
jgi:hypothetical protein